MKSDNGGTKNLNKWTNMAQNDPHNDTQFVAVMTTGMMLCRLEKHHHQNTITKIKRESQKGNKRAGLVQVTPAEHQCRSKQGARLLVPYNFNFGWQSSKFILLVSISSVFVFQTFCIPPISVSHPVGRFIGGYKYVNDALWCCCYCFYCHCRTTSAAWFSI